jgi:hypothetical protein
VSVDERRPAAIDDAVVAFLEVAHAAAIVTTRDDGRPHVARAALGLVDGRLLSSILPDAVRYRHLRRDPRATLFVYDPSDPTQARRWVALETEITVHDGEDAPALNLGLRRALERGLATPPPEGMVSWGGEVMTEDAFLEAVRKEGRIICEFAVTRAYGLE